MTAFETWLIATPLPVVGFALLAAMFLAALGAAGLKRILIASHSRGDGTPESRAGGVEGYVVSGVLGLLALLMSFTFAIAVDRYEARRHLVLEEANAIGTAFLRAQLLPEPHRAQLSGLLARYTDNRLVLAQATGLAERVTSRETNDALVAEIWRATLRAVPSVITYEFSGSLIESVNAVIDLDASRKAAQAAHVPPRIFAALILYQLFSAALLGCVVARSIDWLATTLLFLLLTGVLVLMLDVDRPLDGGVRTSQAPMVELQQFIRTTKFDIPSPPPAP